MKRFTVKELIEELKKYPEDCPVAIIHNDDEDACNTFEVSKVDGLEEPTTGEDINVVLFHYKS